MKKLGIRTLVFAFAAMAVFAAGARAQVDVNVSIGGFYDELSPYGQWVDCSYGQCWVPRQVAAGWQPYSNGQWIYTEYGWTWVSSDPWGGNPYHYGTWASIPNYGWSWVPGTVWAPAWVTWSYSDNYVGWAPLPPTVVFGASGYSGRPIVVRETQYVFVPTNRFVGGNVTAVRVPAQQSAAIFRQTRPVTGFAVSGGIVRNTALPMATIEHASGRKIATTSVQEARMAPRAVSNGSKQWSVVAPAGEVKAAAAARPQTAAHASAPSGDPKAASAPGERHPGNTKAAKSEPQTMESHRPPADAPAAKHPPPPPRPEAASPAQPVSKSRPPSATDHPADKTHHAPADAPSAHTQAPRPASDGGLPPEPGSKPKAQTGKEQPAEQAHRPPADAPAAKHAPPPPRPEAAPPAEHGSKAKPHDSKPPQNDKKPDGEKP